MEKREISKCEYRGFRLMETEIISDTSAGEVPFIRWEISRIEGEFGKTHRHDHGFAISEEAARRKVDAIIDKEDDSKKSN
jgi:hypothetical protein